ncbi:MAG: PD-(D/E)XK nuclease family protein, partial [Verrucomicrobiota bacterium]
LHATVFEQMQSWLENIELAFATDAWRAAEWVAICESGLSGMSAGIIPPALDQVLIGTVDRSRNPELDLVLVLGLNEGIFPATPKVGNLLSETEQAELSKHDVNLGPDKLELLGRERFYGYIACTRSRKRLVLTRATHDRDGRALNPSSFFSLFKQLFPTLEEEKFSLPQDGFNAEHRSELIAPLIRAQTDNLEGLKNLVAWPALADWRNQIETFAGLPKTETLSPELAGQLYGTTLKTSVSSLEQYAACPFRFFVSAGMRAEERRVFEVDVREKGSFQHEILAEFHAELKGQGTKWRQISPKLAREKIGEIGQKKKATFRAGLFETDAQNDFAARSLIESLKDFVETSIVWMEQYDFDPHTVELDFGMKDSSLPAWEIDLGEGHKLAFRGIIDRIDICTLPGGRECLAVIVDYKSSAKQLEPLFLKHGVQLQLPAYLAFLRRLPNPEKLFGAQKLIPAGVFYVNLRGDFGSGKTRSEVLLNAVEIRQSAYQHAGRFDFSQLKHLDKRGADSGTQFRYKLKNDKQPIATSRDAMGEKEFGKLLDDVEQHLVRMGREIFNGVVKIDPYQKGTLRACAQCDYVTICRIDPWRHKYRDLSRESVGPVKD